MAESRTYPVAPFGYGPQFPEPERPAVYASQFRNRFVNSGGGAETRRGLTQVGSTISNVSAPDLNRIHELIEAGGTATLLASGSAASLGRIWSLDTSAGSTWTQVYASADPSARFHSVQFDDKLILGNGVNRNLYTIDASAFDELVPLILQGEAESTATAHDTLVDDKVIDWVGDTDINVNDLLFDATTSAYAIITEVASSELTHQPLTAASFGLMSGNAAKAGGNKYAIHDLVELNIIPAAQEPDNLALGGIGTSATRVRVSGDGINVNFDNTEVRVGDFIRNTTRNAVARITKVSATDLEHTTITGQDVGDSLVFLKYAMPLSDRIHIHYGRAYYNDVRDRRKVRISSPADPQDLTTDAGTLDSTTFKLGAQSPGADDLVSMASFQQYFVFGGRRTIWLFSGTDPIADTSADAVGFSPQSQFPEGLVSPDAMLTIGNDIVFMSPDGMRSAALEGSETLPTRENLSDALREELQAAISAASPANIKLVNYPKRDWVIAKVSNEQYVFNYSPNLASLAHGELADLPGKRGGWSIFDGSFAAMNDYFVRANGELICCDSSGRVFRFDDEGVYTDGATSANYVTRYQTAWYGLDEQKTVGRPSRQVKKTVALLPSFEASANTTYEIAVSGPYENKSGESVSYTVSASGNPVHTPRLPLIARGERVRYDYQTTAAGRDVISHHTILYNRYGQRRSGG